MRGGAEEAPDLARLRAAFALVEDAPAGDGCPATGEIWGCPATGEIWDGLHGALPPERLREVVDHLASCTACAEAWRIGLLLERPPGAAPAAAVSARAAVADRRSGPEAAAGSARDDEQAPRMVAPLRRWLPRRRPVATIAAGAAFAAAAALALVLGISRYLAVPAAQPLTLRGSETQAAATRWVTPDGAVLPRREATIRWTGPAQATYDLILETPDGQRSPARAGARGLTAGEYRIPAADLAKLPAGRPLHAILTAHLADGTSERIFRDFRLQ